MVKNSTIIPVSLITLLLIIYRRKAHCAKGIAQLTWADPAIYERGGVKPCSHRPTGASQNFGIEIARSAIFDRHFQRSF